MRPTGDRVSARQEKVREALEGLNTEMGFALSEKNQLSGIQMRMFQPRIIAALAEVEEWETRLAVAEHEAKGWIQHDTKSYAEATSRAIARAEAAEAEADRLKAALEQIVDESPHNFNARLIARAALGEQT